ncbi:MAG: 50S ribosomal protein L9 [Acidimicrobiia bacterium]|nr:50S ribosomal protein L9 [Acidimicrobiia bacterium]
MKVLLRDDVEHLGRKGDLVDVADGYARNYLMPRGFAMVATKGTVRQAEAMRRSREAREVREREAAEELSGRLASAPVVVTARAGEEGKLFGSITTTEIATVLTERVGVEIDRRKLELDEPIKDLGTTEVRLRLHPDVEAVISVEVVAE